MSNLIRIADVRRRLSQTVFTRFELNQLLSVYSRHVASGEWRDYAIDHTAEFAAFSIYRHSAEQPLFVIAKHRPGTQKRGDFIISSGRRKLRQATTLQDALTVFESRLKLIST